MKIIKLLLSDLRDLGENILTGIFIFCAPGWVILICIGIQSIYEYVKRLRQRANEL